MQLHQFCQGLSPINWMMEPRVQIFMKFYVYMLFLFVLTKHFTGLNHLNGLTMSISSTMRLQGWKQVSALLISAAGPLGVFYQHYYVTGARGMPGQSLTPAHASICQHLLPPSPPLNQPYCCHPFFSTSMAPAWSPVQAPPLPPTSFGHAHPTEIAPTLCRSVSTACLGKLGYNDQTSLGNRTSLYSFPAVHI